MYMVVANSNLRLRLFILAKNSYLDPFPSATHAAQAGPAFIKWGQWAATRPDLFPTDLCHSLEQLQVCVCVRVRVRVRVRVCVCVIV
jgi:hypothetical protein